jgi:magnesium transporter
MGMETLRDIDEQLEELRNLWAGGDLEASARWADEVHPQQILEYWDELEPPEQQQLLSLLPGEKAADVVRQLSETQQGKALNTLTVHEARDLLEQLDPDDLVDTLQALHEHDPEHAASVASMLEPETRTVAEALARYEEDDAGGIMTPDFISLRGSMTVEQALAFLRRVHPDAEQIYYLYVIDNEGCLLGVLSLRELIVAALGTRVADIMNPDVVSIHTATDQEEVARVMADYDFSVIPVVDDARRLVGIVTIDDVLDVVEDEATEDIHRMGAAPIDIDYAHARPWLLFRKRASWLVLLVVSMTLTFNVISHYEHIIAEVVILAAFIPLLIGTGGNVGAQVSTLVVRALATRELEMRDVIPVLLKEMATGLMLGAAFGLFMAIYVLLFRAEPLIALALGITMVLIALAANLVGAMLPFAFRRLGIDPALTSSPAISTVMDVLGLLIYFRVVLWVLGPMLAGR